MRIVIGLGNYGQKYEHTFHNMGFMAADLLAKRFDTGFKTKQCESLIGETFYCGQRIIIAKPLTYMNMSGWAAKQLLKRYKACEDELIVIYDDIDLDKGKIRYRSEGSGGTHNGMRNVVDVLGTQKIPRIRIGIGRPKEGMELVDYVLSRVPSGEWDILSSAISEACDTVVGLITASKDAN